MTSGVSLSLLSCWAALLASICACLLSRLPTRKEKGKCYLKRMLATPSEYVTCSFACPVSFSASVQPHALRSLQLFLELLLGALARAFFGALLVSLQLFLELLLVTLARAFFEAFPVCIDSFHYPFGISMDHKYSL